MCKCRVPQAPSNAPARHILIALGHRLRPRETSGCSPTSPRPRQVNVLSRRGPPRRPGQRHHRHAQKRLSGSASESRNDGTRGIEASGRVLRGIHGPVSCTVLRCHLVCHTQHRSLGLSKRCDLSPRATRTAHSSSGNTAPLPEPSSLHLHAGNGRCFYTRMVAKAPCFTPVSWVRLPGCTTGPIRVV